jgi:hypothetical protein
VGACPYKEGQSGRKGDVIPFRGDDTLLTALTAWSIMDLSAKSPDLSRRMDGMSFSISSILLHEDNGRASMGLYKTSSSDQGKLSNGGLPNPGDMSPLKVRGRDDARIRAGYASIGTTVHERAERQRGPVPGEVILNSMGVDLVVDTSINVDETVLGMLGTCSNSRRNGLVGGKNLPDEIVSPAGRLLSHRLRRDWRSPGISRLVGNHARRRAEVG